MLLINPNLRLFLAQCSTCGLILVILIGHNFHVSSVVVDGGTKDELSASKHQRHNEAAVIDSFNIRTCGMSDPNVREHEFVNMAREGQFPWMVSFQIRIMPDANYTNQLKGGAHHRRLRVNSTYKQEGFKKRSLEDLHFCSGSFISDKWILSAAHCFVGDTLASYLKHDKLKVVAGSHKVSSRSPLNKNLTIERIYYHSRFDKLMPIGFDIALVELRGRVALSQKRSQNGFGEQQGSFMNAICLPKRDDDSYKFNETARLAGWGMSQAKDVHSMPSKLLTTDILLTKRDECAQQYSKRLKSEKPKERRDFICASYKTVRDACQSDSGGPLMQYVNQKAVVIGIVSYGIGCATNGVPGLYTRTSVYIDWIRDITTNGPDASVEFKLLEAKGKQIGFEKESHTSSFSSTSTSTSTSTSYHNNNKEAIY